MVEQLRKILKFGEDLEPMVREAGLPSGYIPLFLELRQTQSLSRECRPLNLKELDDILIAYWAGRYTAEQLSMLKAALIGDDSTARLFVKRLMDHQGHIRAGMNAKEAGLSMDALIKRGRSVNNSSSFYKKWAAVWIFPIAATILTVLLWPRLSIYDKFNFDQEPPLAFQTDVQRNLLEYTPLSSPVDSFFINGMKAYLACDYKQALNIWAGHPMKGKHERLIRLYSALSYIGLALSRENGNKQNDNNISRAITLLRGLGPDISDTERYFYALALILAERDSEAREQLKHISDPDVQARAEKLLPYVN